MRLIDGDALIEQIEQNICKPCKERKDDYNGVRCRACQYGDEIDDIYDASTVMEWVPCSERLPEEETDVLVTRTFLGCKDGCHGWNSHIPPKTYVEIAQYFGGEWTALSDEYKVARSRHTDPVAWMPLPEPYKGEQT